MHWRVESMRMVSSSLLFTIESANQFSESMRQKSSFPLSCGSDEAFGASLAESRRS